jgi:hypothetical protein
MSDPLQRATSSAPPVLGEGCTQRYDPAALTAETGCDFAEAAALWQALETEQMPQDQTAGSEESGQ